MLLGEGVLHSAIYLRGVMAGGWDAEACATLEGCTEEQKERTDNTLGISIYTALIIRHFLARPCML